jgi:TPR repeat protein
MLLYGNGVRQDEQEAATWLHKAALQGHIQALSELGGMYLFGRGVERRIAIAAEMLTVAALDLDMNALGTLADYHGEIEQEALSGSLLSALSLAKMYDRGLGVERSKIKMLAWLMFGMKYGIRDGDADVREELGDMREFYSLVMTPTDKVAAKKLVKQMVALVAGRSGPG